MKTLKHLEVLRNEYCDLSEACASIHEFIEKVYNQKPLHSALGYLPPPSSRHHQQFKTRWPHGGRVWHEFFAALGNLSTRCTFENRERYWRPAPGAHEEPGCVSIGSVQELFRFRQPLIMMPLAKFESNLMAKPDRIRRWCLMLSVAYCSV
jgi:hypothetical protein